MQAAEDAKKKRQKLGNGIKQPIVDVGGKVTSRSEISKVAEEVEISNIKALSEVQ